MIKILLLCVAFVATTWAQVLPLRGLISGSSVLYQITLSPTTGLTFEIVAMDTTVSKARNSSGSWVISSNVVVPPPPTHSAWITLTQSTADPLTWCTGGTPPGGSPTYYSAGAVYVRYRVTPAVPASPWEYETTQQVTLGSTGTAPFWVATACGGSPGIVLAPLPANTTITQVQAIVVW